MFQIQLDTDHIINFFITAFDCHIHLPESNLYPLSHILLSHLSFRPVPLIHGYCKSIIEHAYTDY